MKMSDFDSFSKAIQKKFFRTKEKVLESLGKADKTTDGDFDSLAATFNEQHATANKLLRAYRNYSAQVKAMSVASKNMHQAVSDAYEPNWDGAENFAVQTEQLNKIWDDHFAKVSETIQFHIVSYVSKFPELKNKIAKRGRKLLDYDRARHKLDALERSKKRDEYKITSATRDLNAAQSIYETINNELFEEIPVLYNSRIPLLSNYFSMFLRTEASFEEELTKIKRQMADLTAGLSKEQNLIASNAVVGTLRAKTLPRREPPKMVPTDDKKGRYSPQLAARGIQVRNMDKGATLPPKPPSPKTPPFFVCQPPPPKEPAPPPPMTVPPYSVPTGYSTVGLPKATTTTSTATATAAPQKPPQPHFGFYTPQSVVPLQNPTQANQPLLPVSSSSSSPPPVPPPPSCLSSNDVSSPPQQASASVDTRNMISYVPQLTPLSSGGGGGQLQQQQQPQSQQVAVVVVEHDNPFEADLRAELTQAELNVDLNGAKETTKALTELSEAGKKAAEAALETTDDVVGKAGNAINSASVKLSAFGQEATSSVGAAAAAAATTVGQHLTSNDVSRSEAKTEFKTKTEEEVEKAKEGVSEVGKTITENIDIVAGQMAAAANATVDGAVNAALNVVSASEVKNEERGSGEIVLPTNRYSHKVQATHCYVASDTDEMTLDVGDVIYVLPINNKEFEVQSKHLPGLDEGWALGLKQKDGTKGMFPVNFTRRMD